MENAKPDSRNEDPTAPAAKISAAGHQESIMEHDEMEAEVIEGLRELSLDVAEVPARNGKQKVLRYIDAN